MPAMSSRAAEQPPDIMPDPTGRQPVRMSERTRAAVWFVMILVALVLLWEGYKLVGNAVARWIQQHPQAGVTLHATAGADGQ